MWCSRLRRGDLLRVDPETRKERNDATLVEAYATGSPPQESTTVRGQRWGDGKGSGTHDGAREREGGKGGGEESRVRAQRNRALFCDHTTALTRGSDYIHPDEKEKMVQSKIQ